MISGLFEFLGYVGAVLGLLGYFLISTQKLEGTSPLYQGLSVTSATMLGLYTFECGAYASVLVNIIGILIGIRTFMGPIGVLVRLSSQEKRATAYEKDFQSQIID